MKAAVVPKIGDKWEVKEVPTPHPATNQVLIKMHASGLCYTDVHITEGSFGPTSLPIGTKVKDQRCATRLMVNQSSSAMSD